MPTATDSEKEVQQLALEKATLFAIETPFEIMKVAFESMNILEEMAKKGMEASASDVGVGIICARAAIRGAFLNVQINAKDLKNREAAEKIEAKGKIILQEAKIKEEQILEIIDAKIKTAD